MECNFTVIEFINMICNVMTTIFAGIGLYAISIAKDEYIHNKSKESAQKAIDMAEYFRNNILTELTIINQISVENGLNEIISKVRFYEMIDFDTDEMKKLFESDEIRNINKIIDNTKIRISAAKSDGEDIGIPFNTFVSQVLNKLEYMCMHFSSNIADDDYIYNSLHQVFITSMQLCYCSIAELNVSNKDKYYTNIISVYNKWSKKYFKAQENEEIIQEELNQRKKEATKPSIKSIKK